ncbi:GmrSD restriction endonuclease domain-containing protein [Sphingobium ummariense]
MAKAEASVEELVGMVERGELRLPEMQRQYVWRSPRVRDLMDSLYRGYPSGAILLWETDEAVPLQDMAIAQAENPYAATRLLLDGQQRLTSLSAIIRGEPVKVRGRVKPIELLFNLEHPERQEVITEVDEDADEEETETDEVDSTEDDLQRRFERMTFVVATNKLAALAQWVKVSEVFKSDSDTSFLKGAGVTGFDDPRYEKYSKRLAQLRRIRKYVYRMDVLERSLTYEEVTEIFVRVNSLGAKLRSSDLALAQITARWRHSLEIFQSFQTECAKLGFDLDLGIHLKTLIAFATGQSRFLTAGRLSLDALQTGWKEATEEMRFAINFLKSNVGIDGPALLSSPFLMIVVAYFGHAKGYALSPEESDRLRQWALLANAKGRFSRGSSETILDQDLGIISKGGSADALIDRVRLQFGRLNITPEDLEGRDQRSSLFKTMFLTFRALGAKDWTSNLQISLDHSGSQHRLQFHHFFPKALLTKNGFSSRDADDVANLTFIGGRTNRKISDKAPSIYLADFLTKQGPDLLALQGIPSEPELLEVGSYRAFLEARRVLLAKAVNEFLGVTDE